MPNIDLCIKLHSCLEMFICDEILYQAREEAEELGSKTTSVNRACTGPAPGGLKHCLAAALLDSPYCFGCGNACSELLTKIV